MVPSRSEAAEVEGCDHSLLGGEGAPRVPRGGEFVGNHWREE